MNEETFDKFFVEIQMVMRRYQASAVGLTGPELLSLRREETEALLDLVTQQKRAIMHAQGEPVEPMMQFGKGVLIGKGGGP